MILEVKDVDKMYHAGKKKEIHAVDHVSFSLEQGEILGVVGESGCGKSTLAGMIMHIEEADSGLITLDGEDIRYKKDYYQHIQMVFQQPRASFDPRRTIGDGVGESLRNAGMKKEAVKKRVGELLARCGLSAKFAARYPHEISGGECQRAAIARALTMEPQILVCDEATSSLDVTVQKQIMDLFYDLQKTSDLSFIFICHNLALVQSFCTRVLVMEQGRMVEQGTPDEIIKCPQTDYTKRLIEAAW